MWKKNVVNCGKNVTNFQTKCCTFSKKEVIKTRETILVGGPGVNPAEATDSKSKIVPGEVKAPPGGQPAKPASPFEISKDIGG